MGRRKIEMEYLEDDRVRKVTFCKRKGGLFKKADDLSKLCGVQIAVLIYNPTTLKTNAFSSIGEDKEKEKGQYVNTIIANFQAANGGAAIEEGSQIDMMNKKEQQLQLVQRELWSSEQALRAERKRNGTEEPAAIEGAPVSALPSAALMQYGGQDLGSAYNGGMQVELPTMANFSVPEATGLPQGETVMHQGSVTLTSPSAVAPVNPLVAAVAAQEAFSAVPSVAPVNPLVAAVAAQEAFSAVPRAVPFAPTLVEDVPTAKRQKMTST